ncbi:MAG: (2Fe-2S)-binding protein [bacterium]|nr:(2Fe-2S)-binding protein [Planctomycetota bacterium]HIL52223.1 (2Fe-2S)-binding protein [Planctomycetota bacterium]
MSRRAFLKGAGGVAAGGVLAGEAAARLSAAGEGSKATPVVEGETKIEFTLNGTVQQVQVEPRTTLLGLLRSHLPEPLTGAKEVCDRGTCGACTVILDGEVIYACATLALTVAGREVLTVEGLAGEGKLTAVQRAMVAEDGSMCGFCTPGFVMSLSACLERNPGADENEVRRACTGNLCRCGTYDHIFRAAEVAGTELSLEPR